MLRFQLHEENASSDPSVDHILSTLASVKIRVLSSLYCNRYLEQKLNSNSQVNNVNSVLARFQGRIYNGVVENITDRSQFLEVNWLCLCNLAHSFLQQTGNQDKIKCSY